jgi:prevent-host-death family protein
MITLGSFEAKTKLSELLHKVRTGEEVIITKHGVPVARLSPYRNEPNKKDIAAAVEEIRRAREKSSLDGIKLKGLIEEGRK